MRFTVRTYEVIEDIILLSLNQRNLVPLAVYVVLVHPHGLDEKKKFQLFKGGP